MTKLKLINQIMKWNVAVKVERISQTWMTRKMSFYAPWFIDVTDLISEMTWWSTDKNWYLIVSWCWMDMCFRALYCALPYAKARERKQRYITL